MIPCDLPPEETRPALPFTVEGGCHCGAVRFRVTVRRRRVSECNCSMCTMKGFRHVIVPGEDFVLLSGKENLSTYTFNTRTAKHHFCRTCGIHSFYVPRSHPDGFSVNERCLEGAPADWFDLEPFDGHNWEAAVAAIR
jgi:hypothetical protein